METVSGRIGGLGWVSVSIRWSCVSVREVHHDRRRIYAQAHSAQTMRGPLPLLRGATPVMGRCTRYEPLHPIRRGALPTDRVQRTQSQEQTRNLRDDRRHNSARAHPLRGATPVMGRCTRYEPLHPIRRGALPTDRVQRTQSQEQTRNLRDDGRHNSARTATPVTGRCTRYEPLHPL